MLKDRLAARAPIPVNPAGDAGLEWALSRADPAAAGRQPEGTLILRSDRLTPAELADEVLAATSSIAPNKVQRSE
ncbi:hypothetical protein LWC34_20240 [Kibdelosporangium philippinense]|uniref:Uncharacterized protein n=1 Tax=Kibdelosporangium philippinense TaxID=211113 RepID=A0ABS8ZD40_9PSEU|nr:hypothetical protein [Kibdelosporangium philippinense]MCE7005139.1 hypothetical protein [Kibdelosporangium philippinense]